MIKVDSNHCTGCAICAANCPKRAISIVRDLDGFSSNKVDPRLCVDCHICEQVCPQIKPELFAPQAAYLCFCKNQLTRSGGSSGGFFGLLAQWLIQQGWYVCGASWNGLKVEHRIIHDAKDIPLLEKSKYVQSSLGNTFFEMKELLQKGSKVAFVGTPCQVEAFRKFLRGRFDSQILFIDFLCHGVPPQTRFDRFIKEEESQRSIRILSFSFRAKSRNNPHSFSYTYTRGRSNRIRTKRGASFELPYYQAFLSYSIFIPACYRCQFAQEKRAGDLTLGDGWESETVSRRFQTWGRKRGVSEILVNTDKGTSVFKTLSSQLVYRPIEKEFIRKTNASFREPVHLSQDDFLRINSELRTNFSKTVKDHFTYSPQRKFKQTVAEACPRWFFSLVHRLHHRKAR